MSAALAAELSNDAEFYEDAPQPPLAAASWFLQVDGADDYSSADEQLPDAPAPYVAARQPPAGLSGSANTVPQTESSHTAQGGSQGFISGVQHPLGGMVAMPAALPQAGMLPYPAGAQVPAAQQAGGQHLVPHADTLTAALQHQVSALSRVLGPSEEVRQALQRQMLALQHNGTLQQPSAPAAYTGSYLAPGMLGQVPVYYASSPGEMGQPAIYPGVPQPAAQRPQPVTAKRAAPAQPNSRESPRNAKHAVAAPFSRAEPAQSALSSHAPLAAPANIQAAGAGAQRPLPGVAWQAAAKTGPPAAVQASAAAESAADGHAPDTGIVAQRPLSAGFDSAAEAQVAFGRPTAPAGQPPSGAEAAMVSCAGTGARWHFGCLPQEAQQQVKPWCNTFIGLS